MKNSILISNKFKKAGWILLIPSVVLGVAVVLTDYEADWLNLKVFAVLYNQVFEKTRSFQWVETNITNTVIGVLFIVGAMLVSFSKEKNEDEFIANLRLTSLLWAVCVNYILLLLAFIFIYGTDFLSVMIYNMFTILIIFIVRFHFILYKNNKAITDEK